MNKMEGILSNPNGAMWQGSDVRTILAEHIYLVQNIKSIGQNVRA